MLRAEQIVKLSQVKGVGRAKLFKLNGLLCFSPNDDRDLADVLLENSKELNIFSLSYDDVLQAFYKGEEIIEKSKDKGIKFISFNDSNYPSLLKEIKTPPILLNAIGTDLSVLNNPSVAVIGTRHASTYGKQIGERIGFKLGESKINVVSGLAIGCDTAAHVGCLKANGITVAILAHGLDSVYPKENKKLAEIIVEQGGVLLSEYFVGTRGLPNFFVERDRIQAGMCKGTIVIETDVKGGTMHTVEDTLEANRLLAAYNHPLEKQHEKSRGNQLLISQGKAIPLQTKEDIENLMYLVNPELLKKPESITKTQISEIQLPLFNAAIYDALYQPEKIIKIEKRKIKKSKKPVHPNIFKMPSVIFDLDLTLIDTSVAASAREKRNWKGVYKLVPEFKIYDGILDVLKYLQEHEIRYCIVTSSPKPYCETVCKHWNISPNHMICYHDTKNKKPHPDPIHLAVSKLQQAVTKMKNTKDKVLSFGDRDIDIIASNEAGVISIACLWGNEDKESLLAAKPTYVINSPSEIIPLIEMIQTTS